MISLERRLLDVYHGDADTDHGAYTDTHARPPNAPRPRRDVSACKISVVSSYSGRALLPHDKLLGMSVSRHNPF